MLCPVVRKCRLDIRQAVSDTLLKLNYSVAALSSTVKNIYLSVLYMQVCLLRNNNAFGTHLHTFCIIESTWMLIYVVDVCPRPQLLLSN